MCHASCESIASLRFQPTKRPQITAQKPKAKAIASKFALPSTTTVSAPGLSETTENATTHSPAPQAPQPKTTLADWTATASDDEDVNNFYTENRQRGGRKKRKKNNKQTVGVTQNWDDIYDPSRPNNYEEYKHSEEKIHEVREWKDLLYRHRMRRRDYSDSEDDEYQRPMNSKESVNHAATMFLTVCRTICSASNVVCSTAKYQRRESSAATAVRRSRRCHGRGRIPTANSDVPNATSPTTSASSLPGHSSAR